jgi:membrane-associated phospholipid phosphatase
MSTALALCPIRSSVARVVSDVFSPPVLAIPALVVGVLASDVSGTYRFAVIYFLIAVVAPVLYVVWLLKSGRISDFHLPNRRERRGPFVASLACGMVGVCLLAYLGAPRTFLAPVLALLTQTLLLFLITLSWKVSVHTATTASLITFACLALGPAAAFFAWLVPLVAWARIYLRRHTVAQTLVGACVGTSCFLVLFALHGIIW